jgi:hypothetical protein
LHRRLDLLHSQIRLSQASGDDAMLIIRHLSGRLAGEVQRIAPQLDRVMFGRDPSVCTVVFPPDDTLVARRHFALVLEPSGEWTVDLLGGPYVEIDGTPAEITRQRARRARATGRIAPRTS